MIEQERVHYAVELLCRTLDVSAARYYADNATRIRVFWGQYDADWTLAALLKTRKRLLKKI